MPDHDRSSSDGKAALRQWVRTPAGKWILFALALLATCLMIALSMTFA